jgi:hypothetical protein
MIAEVPIVDESEEAASKEAVLETVEESVESPTEPSANSVCVQEALDFEVEIVEAPKRKRPPKAQPKPQAEPKPKAQPKPKPRPRKAQPIAPPEPLQPVIPDRFASLSSTELVAELLHRRSHQERDNRRLLYRSFLS